VFIGTRDWFVHARNLTSGEEYWTYRTGGSVDSSPAYADGYLYVGSGDSRLYCLDADPLEDGIDEGMADAVGSDYDFLWTHTINGPVWGSPLVVNNVIYVTTSPGVNPTDPNPGRLYAISVPPGGAPTELWYFVLPNNAPIYTSPLVYENLVIFGANDNRVYAINRTTGQEEWNVTTGDSIKSSPAAADGLVYIGSNDFKLYAIYTSNGSIAWSKPTGSSITSSPAVADGVVYVGSLDNKLYAFNAVNGDELWTYEVGDGIWSSPAVASDFVVFGSFDGNLYVVNTTSHELKWSSDVGVIAQSSPALAQGDIVIAAGGGDLVAYGKAPDLALDWNDVKFSLSTPQVGVNVTITANITNIGTVSANATIKFYDQGSLIGTDFVDIAPGGYQMATTNWIPMEAGNHILSVNITNVLPHDSDQTNNQVQKSMTVLEQTEGWRMFHKDELHGGVLDVPTPNNNKVLWSYHLPGTTKSSPVVADQLLFIGDSEGIYSLVENPPGTDGVKYWNKTIPGVETTPAIVNAVVYAPSSDGNLYAFDAWNGIPIWDVDIGTGLSSPIVYNHTIFIGTTDGDLVAIHSNGTVLWEQPLGGEIVGSPAIYDNVVIVGSANGPNSKVTAFDIDTGIAVWNFPVFFAIRASPSIFVDQNDFGYVYISDTNGTVYKLEAFPDFKDDGLPNPGDNYDLIWKYSTGIPIYTTAAVSGNNIYLTAGNNTIISLTSLGDLSWKREYAIDENKPLMSSPAVAENKIFVGGDKIYCLDTTTGLEVWNYDTFSTVSSSPAITLGKVFIASDAGVLYAFGNITPVAPQAKISSPTDGGKYRNEEAIEFNASGSYDDGVILEYLWDFGDGAMDYGEVVTHSYELIGNYTVTLTVKDNEVPPLSNTTQITIEIIPNARPSLIDAAVTPGEGNVSTEFNFTVTYSDPDNDPPDYVEVMVSGETYSMDPVNPTNLDYVNGVVFYCATELLSDNHTYSFKASDGVLDVSSISGSGPKVWQTVEFVKDEITVVIKFVGQGKVVIELPTLPPEPPTGLVKKDIVRITPENIIEWEWMYLEINGSGRNITEGVVTSTLQISWYNGTGWVELDTILDLVSEKFSTNITSSQAPVLGIFGLFGEPVETNELPTIRGVTSSPKGPYKPGDKIEIIVDAIDPEEDDLFYKFEWDDKNKVTDWLEENSAEHKFNKSKTYRVTVYVTDDITHADNRTVKTTIDISIREEGSSQALIVLAVIIFVVLAIVLLVPSMGAKEEEEEEKEPEEEEEKEVEEEEAEEEEEETVGEEEDEDKTDEEE
jgi:outer membrane protein assembly factor BamB